MAANRLADEVQACIEADEALVNEYHTVDGGKYYGFGLSEHIGFVYWNDEDNKLPIRMYITPANRPRMIVSRVKIPSTHRLLVEWPQAAGMAGLFAAGCQPGCV